MPIAEDKIATYREILIERRAALLGQVESLAKDVASSAESTERSKSPLNPAENASDTFEQDFAFITMESEEDLVRKIDSALQRIRDGSFGTCDGCGAEINAERLEVLPFADLCLECQEQSEITGVRRRSDDEFEILDEPEDQNTPGDDD